MKRRNIVDAILNGEGLTEEEARAIAWDDYYEDQCDERLKPIGEFEGEELRWHRIIQTVFSINGKLWAIDWRRGLTECQESEFWDSQPYRVKKQEKKVTEYVPIKEEK